MKLKPWGSSCAWIGTHAACVKNARAGEGQLVLPFISMFNSFIFCSVPSPTGIVKSPRITLSFTIKFSEPYDAVDDDGGGVWKTATVYPNHGGTYWKSGLAAIPEQTITFVAGYTDNFKRSPGRIG